MISPSLQEFKKRAQKGDLIPVYSECLADIETPVTLFLKIADQHQAFLLESAEVGEKIGRYSFVGTSPHTTLELNNQTICIKTAKKSEQKKLTSKNDVFQFLRELIHQLRYVPNQDLPGFVGGLVGYLGYEFVQFCDDVQLRKKQGLKLPDGVFFLMQHIVIYDHLDHTIKLVYLANCAKENPEKAYQTACHFLKQIEQKIKHPISHLSALPTELSHDTISTTPVSNMSKGAFIQKVKKIKSYIRAGDCIQVVPSQRFKLKKVKNDFEVYRALRSLNPSPYMFYFRHYGLRLVGSSPETLVKKHGQIAEIRPIAGTRPRGKTELQDQLMENNLRASKKEMAEHLMLVDLGRNDLGRVCQTKSVQVTEFAQVERYSHVMHLVSDVKGKLLLGKDAFDLLKACFPAGTVTGAPKIRAMQIIDELESECRGPYAGAVGYFSFNGDMDLCITIRTIVVENGMAYVQAGAGIVNDSNPQREFQETVNKAKALIRAVEIAGNL